MKAREILKKENKKIKEQRAAKKEAIKAKRMLAGEDEEPEDFKRNGKDPLESDSDNEGFSSEEESFRSTLEITDKKAGVNNTASSNTFVTTTEDNLKTQSQIESPKLDPKGNPY